MAFFNKKKDKEEKKPTDSDHPVAAPATSVPTGGDSQSYRVIVGPHVTEKASLGNASGAYVFTVTKHANKIEIRRAIEKLYKVTVRQVRVVNLPSKFRQIGKYQGEKSGFKKAIVSLKKGQTIDIV